MSSANLPLAQLEGDELKLPPALRAALVERLIAGLDDDREPEVAVKADESEGRYRELRSGVVRGKPAAQVFARLRSQLR